jgi:hypothetical protein
MVHGQTVVPYSVLLGLSILMYQPGQLPGKTSVISGELQAGGNSLCLYLAGVLF